MTNQIDSTPVTVHGDGTITGTNVNNIINVNGKNKFLEKYNDTKKTDTEQLLQGLPEFIIKDLVLYFLLDNYPKRTSYVTGTLETFVNQLTLKHIKDVKIYDMIQWCKTAIKARNEGIENGYAFLDYCDTGVEKELGYLDLMKHVKNELPINEYLLGLEPEDTLKYLSESSFNYMVQRISKNKYLFEQCEDYEALQATIDGLREGKDVEEEYLALKKKIERNREKYYRLNSTGKITKSALETGFTANLSEEECREENQRNLQLEATGANKFKFGHRWLNLITGGGLESKQLMIYGAPSGNGKTTMMISSTIDMAMYNPDVKYEKGYSPCILYISAETGLKDIKGRYIKMLTGTDISWDDDFSGEKKYLSDEEEIEYFTKLAKEYGGKLTAKWVYGLVIYNENGAKEYSYSKDNFYFVDKPSNKINPGYPLDSISIIPEYNKYLVDLTKEEKEKLNKDDKEKKDLIEFIVENI